MFGEDRVKQLLASSTCEVCGHGYELARIRVIGRIANNFLLQARCTNCHTPILAAACIEFDGPASASVGCPDSDLMPWEVEKFKKVIITNDDVIDMHIFLEGLSSTPYPLF